MGYIASSPLVLINKHSYCIRLYTHPGHTMGPKRKLNTGGGSRTSSHNKTTTTAATTIGTDGRNKSTQVVEGTGTTITKGQGGGDNTTGSTNELPQSAGYLISCDVPTKQFIVSLEKDKDFGIKNFILEDLDPTHLLVKKQARSKIEGRVEKWMDDNVYSPIERIGENLDTS